MKILKIHKYFYIHGGDSRVFFETADLLKKHNHKLAYFSMRDTKNKRSAWNKYFVSNISMENNTIWNYPKILRRVIYSKESQEKISKLLDVFMPQIAHLYHIYHHISPSIISELKQRNIPIIEHLHDYHFIAPNYTLFHDGAICEVTKPTKFYKAIFHKCIKHSYLASTLETAEKYIHNYLGLSNSSDRLILPSRFMTNKFIEYGVPQNKISYLHNFIDTKKYASNNNLGSYILYFGRLSSEKGLDILLNAAQLLPHINIVIAGDGSQRTNLLRISAKLNLKNVKFYPFLNDRNIKKLISESRATILPSVWYENSPKSILESYASGKPVIASDIGGIPELVDHGQTGLLFKPGSIEDCAEKINKLWENKNSYCITLGKQSRAMVKKRFSPEEYYQGLLSIYQSVLKHRGLL